MGVEVCGLPDGGGRSGSGAAGRLRPRRIAARRPVPRRDAPRDAEPHCHRSRRHPVLSGRGPTRALGLRVPLGAPLRPAPAVRRPGLRSAGNRPGPVLPGHDRARGTGPRGARRRRAGFRLLLPFRFPRRIRVDRPLAGREAGAGKARPGRSLSPLELARAEEPVEEEEPEATLADPVDLPVSTPPPGAFTDPGPRSGQALDAASLRRVQQVSLGTGIGLVGLGLGFLAFRMRRAN